MGRFSRKENELSVLTLESVNVTMHFLMRFFLGIISSQIILLRKLLFLFFVCNFNSTYKFKRINFSVIHLLLLNCFAIIHYF